MSEQKKIALITGATRGIGKAIAEQLVEANYFVIGTATSENGMSTIKSFLGANGDAFVLDVSSPESIEAILKNIAEQYGVISVLVNNAGITKDQLLMRMKDEDWSDVITTNLTSIYRLSKAVMRDMMKARFGRIVNITSIVGVTGNAGQTNYAAAKSGVIGFSKSMAIEVASRGITVNCVAPGFIDTDMTKDLPDAVKETMLKNIPMNCLGKPEDIASAVKFLVSDESRYITGETIHVNGGMFMP